jgi:hypothetical protein
MKKKKKSERKQKMEFSKKILCVVAVLNIAVLLFACIMIWRTGNLDPFAYIIPSLAAEAATGTGFYYNKSKAENQIKLEYTYSSSEKSIEDTSDV